MGKDGRLFRMICNAVILSGIVMTPLLVIGVLPTWIGSALFLFALMWIGVGLVLQSTERRRERR
jgi:hypothetical protein